MNWRDKVAKIPPAVRKTLKEKYEEKHKRGELTWLDLSELQFFAEHYSDPNRYTSPKIEPQPRKSATAQYRLPDTTPQWTSETTKKTPSTK